MKANYFSVFFVAILFGIHSSTAQSVNFTLYYESLCGGCRDFIKQQYYPTFKLIGSIMNVHLVPYGNAQETQEEGKWVYYCQHGKEECIGNLIETCAMYFYPNASVFFPFIHCIETSSSLPRTAAPSCAQEYNLDYSKIQSCASGDLGNSLEHEMALKTQALNPPHSYVPWVTLEGAHTDQIQNEAEFNLIGLICGAYKGSPKPQACQQYQEKNFIQRCAKQTSRLGKANISIN
jgi:interferon gamma-inducible protein 30